MIDRATPESRVPAARTETITIDGRFPARRPPVLLTGLYGHTQIEGARGARALARELASMVRIVSAIERAASGQAGQM